MRGSAVHEVVASAFTLFDVAEVPGAPSRRGNRTWQAPAKAYITVQVLLSAAPLPRMYVCVRLGCECVKLPADDGLILSGPFDFPPLLHNHSENPQQADWNASESTVVVVGALSPSSWISLLE